MLIIMKLIWYKGVSRGTNESLELQKKRQANKIEGIHTGNTNFKIKK